MASDILRRVGWALIVVGLIDIGAMIYCIMNDMSYSSSLNIFAVIGGFLLLRQSMRTARVASFFAAFMLSGMGLSAILFPLLLPFDLVVTHVRLHPFGTIGAFIVGLAFLGFVFWIYRSLTSPAVMEARRVAGVSAKKPWGAFVAGTALAVGLSIVMLAVNTGPTAAKAIAKAKETTGPNYKYYVTSMQWAGNSGSATVTAYNTTEIREVRVEW